jgi:hypothetical protein
MAAQEFDIKQHDLEPPLIVTCLDGGAAVDLTTAVSARLLLRNLTAGLKVNAFCTILDQSVPANLGKVKYIWQGTDTDTVGVFNGEIEIIWPGNRPQTFPAAKAAKYFKVNVHNDLTD